MKNLALERKRRDLTQQQAARELGIGAKTLGKYESNPLTMPGDFIVKAAKFYNCPVGYLLDIPSFQAGSHSNPVVVHMEEFAPSVNHTGATLSDSWESEARAAVAASKE